VHWWAQCDAPGVVFVFAATSLEAVETLMAGLPLVKEQLVDLTMTRLGPLQPLQLLLGKAQS
jgi:hypothetical protein